MAEDIPISDQELYENIDELFEHFTQNQKEYSAAELFLVRHFYAIHQSLMIISSDQMLVAQRRFEKILNDPDVADSDERAHLALARVVVGAMGHLSGPKKS